jgi:glycosyltransferase involved in cell wall biosynthesis
VVFDERFSTTRGLRHSGDEVALRPRRPTGAPAIPWGGLRAKGFVKSNLDNPLITVVTVVFNGQEGLENTIQSVIGQSYDNIEYIVVDGGSTDNTLQIIKRYEHAIDLWISEPDRGIYDGMNKAVALSSGDWLNFMNCKDTFHDPDTVRNLVDGYIRVRKAEQLFFYSDVVICRPGASEVQRLELYKTDHRRKRINHQASVYLKALHEVHGLYLVAKGMTIADYFFFSLIDPRHFVKVDRPIVRYDMTGVSQSKRAHEQMFIVDHLINGTSRGRFLMYFNFYFYYHRLKDLFRLLRDVAVGAISKIKAGPKR